jgi:sulfur-carrier protein adenylyltransferase/sulfurtransferase
MAMTSRDLLAAARAVIPEVSVEHVHSRPPLPGRVLIDVRERTEYESGHLPGAIHISKSFIEVLLEEEVPDRDTPITLYCAGGVRSLLAAESVRRLGYTNVESMADGVGGWKASGYELVRAAPLWELSRSA